MVTTPDGDKNVENKDSHPGHKLNLNSPTKLKYSRLTQHTKETKTCIYQLRTKLTKAPTGKQN